jgi:hypothetical protein
MKRKGMLGKVIPKPEIQRTPRALRNNMKAAKEG